MREQKTRKILIILSIIQPKKKNFSINLKVQSDHSGTRLDIKAVFFYFKQSFSYLFVYFNGKICVNCFKSFLFTIAFVQVQC